MVALPKIFCVLNWVPGTELGTCVVTRPSVLLVRAAKHPERDEGQPITAATHGLWGGIRPELGAASMRALSQDFLVFLFCGGAARSPCTPGGLGDYLSWLSVKGCTGCAWQ